MSKYLKMMAMKSGGKVRVQKAVIGSLIGRGARKGVEMLTVSKSAIQKGAKDKVARDKFQESLKDFQRGKPENLENLPLSSFKSMNEDISGMYKSANKIMGTVPAASGKVAKAETGFSGLKNALASRPKTTYVGAATGAGAATGVAIEAGRRMEKTKALDEKTFLGALRKIVKGE